MMTATANTSDLAARCGGGDAVVGGVVTHILEQFGMEEVRRWGQWVAASAN